MLDVARLAVPADTFDLVVCGFAVHIVQDPYAALAEAVRVVKRGWAPGVHGARPHASPARGRRVPCGPAIGTIIPPTGNDFISMLKGMSMAHLVRSTP